jgi:hypothetical protein
MAYWIVIACGGFDNVQPASLVLFELPTFLFLIMFSCVVYLWYVFAFSLRLILFASDLLLLLSLMFVILFTCI